MLFDKITKFTSVLTHKMEKIEIDNNRCLKVRSANSKCSSCVDVCPIHSIEIKQEQLEIIDSCIHCGICTNVCETNALKWNHPPLIQLLKQIQNLSVQEPEVFIGCNKALNGIIKTNVIAVPCLGMIPSEFWISLGMNMKNLAIIYEKDICENCRIEKGNLLFKKELGEAERIVGRGFTIIKNYKDEEESQINHQRRKFLMSIFEEAKEINTIAINEMIEIEKTKSPFEKFDLFNKKKNELDEIADSVEELKEQVIVKLFDETMIRKTDKRAIIYQELKNHTELKEKIDFFIPQMDKKCTRCGACVFLCPMDALGMYNRSIILFTSKCVSCGLCEEICYEKHVHLSKRKGTIFDNKFIFLIEES